MAVKKKTKKKIKTKGFEASVSFDADLGDTLKDKFKEWSRENGGHKHSHKHHHGGGFYFLGMVGAAVYYIQNAEGFWNGVVGLLKALVWPAMLVYKWLGM